MQEHIMQKPIMETSLGSELLEDEEVLWSGQPNSRHKSSQNPGKVFLILGLAFLLLGLTIIGIGLTLLYAGILSPDPAGPALGLFIPGGVFTLLGLIYTLVGLLLPLLLNTQTLYAITTRRVIILRMARNRRYVSSYNKQAITQIHRVERPDGEGDLTFATHPRIYVGNQDNSYSTGYLQFGRQGVFRMVPDVRHVQQKLLDMLDNN